MILSHAHGFVFVKGRKVASTSIEIALSRICGPADVITPITPADERVRLELGGTCRNFARDPAIEARYLALVRQGDDQGAIATGVHARRPGAYFNHAALADIEAISGLDPARFTLLIAVRHPYEKIISLANMRLSFQAYDGSPMINDPAAIREMAEKLFETGDYKRVRNTDLYRTERTYRQTVLIRHETLGADLARFMSALGVTGEVALPHTKSGASRHRLDPAVFFTRAQLDLINAHYADELDGYGYRRL